MREQPKDSWNPVCAQDAQQRSVDPAAIHALVVSANITARACVISSAISPSAANVGSSTEHMAVLASFNFHKATSSSHANDNEPADLRPVPTLDSTHSSAIRRR
jgi:hypothetical protein